VDQAKFVRSGKVGNTAIVKNVVDKILTSIES